MENEYEVKALVSKSDFTKLINSLPFIQKIHQKNVYFETEDNYFKKRDSALRIRFIDNTYELTIKQKKQSGNIEWNYMIDELTANQIISDKAIDLSNWNFPFQDCLTNMKIVIIETTRSCLQYNNHIIEADETLFNQTIDYELEIEAQSMQIASNILRELAHDYDLDLQDSMPKIARYYIYNAENT